MTKLTLREFEKFVSVNNAKKFILFSENQMWHTVDDTFRFDITFSNIKISFNPNKISFSNGSECFVSIEKILFITIDEESIIGSVCTLVCESPLESFRTNKYTFIVQ